MEKKRCKMERQLSRVTATLGLAESKKIADRRKFVQDLQGIYANDEFVQVINVLSSKDSKGPASWNEIMLTIHRLAISEAKRADNSRANSVDAAQHACSALMRKTVRLATCGADPTLNCDDFMACVFEVLRDRVYKIYHKTYVDMLAQNVLTNKIYWLEIKAQQWREILRTITKLYKRSSNIPKQILIDALRSVVQIGCLQSHLALDVKKILPFLEEIFNENDKDEVTILRPLYKLVYVVCQQIGTESPMALCEFSKKIIPSIVRSETHPEKISLLLLLIRIGRPDDENLDDDSSRNRDSWKNIIDIIHDDIMREIKMRNHSPYFWELCCEVYRQIIQNQTSIMESSSSLMDEGNEQPRKRRRLSTTVRKPIDLLTINDNVDVASSFVKILTLLMKKHPNCLKSEDYPTFLKTIVELSKNSVKNSTMMDNLFELCTIVVKIEKKYFLEDEEITNVKECWQKICDTVLRTLSGNQNETQGHELIQSIIEHQNILDTTEFLHLYIKTQIRWSFSSVQTLLTFCSHVQLPNEFAESGASVTKPNSWIRAALLHWTLNIPISKLFAEVSSTTVANLLIVLAIKFCHKREFRIFLNCNDRAHEKKIVSVEAMDNELFEDREGKALNDIDRCQSSLEFRQDISEKLDESTKIQDQVSTVVVQKVFELLIKNLMELLTIPLIDKELANFVWKTNVLGKLLSNFLELDLTFEKSLSILFEEFENGYKNILSQLTKMEKPRWSHLVDALDAMENFYRTRYHEKITRIIHDSTSMEFIIHVYKFVSDDADDSENEENCRVINPRDLSCKTKINRLTSVCRVRNSCHRIFTYFCCLRTSGEISTMQMRVLKNLMKIDIYQSASIVGLQRALYVLKYLAEFEGSSSSKESLEIIEIFLKNLFDTRRNDEIFVRGILNVLPDYIKSAWILFVNDDVLLNILSEIHDSLVNEKFGALVHVDFVKCLARLNRLNPSLKWTIVGSKATITIIEILTNYINNPFYSVRLEVASAIGELFSFEHIDVPSKINYFNKILSAIDKLFVTDDRFVDNEIIDESITRNSTSLHLLVAIFRSNEFFQCRSLYAILESTIRRNVRTCLVKRALTSTTTTNDVDVSRTIQTNLHELLSRWFAKGYSLHNFPWDLDNCNSQEDFSKRHINVLLMIKIRNQKLREFVSLCKNLRVSFSRTIEKYFPSFMTILMSTIVERSSKRDDDDVDAESIIVRLRSNVDEFAKIEKYEILLNERLTEILMDLITRLHDRDHLFKITNINFYLPYVNSPNFTVKIVDQCVRLLHDELSLGDDSLMEHLVTRRPSTLQIILSNLFNNIFQAKTTINKILEFHRYVYFCEMMVPEISLSYFDPMSFYVIRDVAHSLMTIAESKESSLSSMACSYLFNLLKTVLPARVKDVKRIMRFVVSKLIPIIQIGDNNGAIDVLRLLIIDHKDILKDYIVKLDSFPNHPVFLTVKDCQESLKYSNDGFYSLEYTIDDFLEWTGEPGTTCSPDGLSHLRLQLSTRKNELKKLYEKLRRSVNDFQDDLGSNALLGLINRLLLIARSKSKLVSHEAVKCLGELGPAELTTIILITDRSVSKENVGQVEMFTFEVIKLLVDYLIAENTNLRKISSDALHVIFSTSWGSTFIDKTITNDFAIIRQIDVTDLHECIYPFASRTTKNHGPVRMDDKNWKNFVENFNDLWKWKNFESYDLWISKMTCRLLDCFVNFYSEAVKPICRLRVEFCEMLLPRLFNLARETKKSTIDDICVCLDRFFRCFVESFATTRISHGTTNANSLESYKLARCILNVVDFMRIQSIDRLPPNLDYLRVAKMAQYCSAWFTSVLYAELWCENVLRETNIMRIEQSNSWTSPIDCVCELSTESGNFLQEIVREAYVKIGDSDCLHGCGFSYLVRSSFKTQYHCHLEQWDKVTLAQDVAMTCGRDATRGMLNALEQSGQQYLARCMIKTVKKKMKNVDDFMYETAWRLADWNILGDDRQTDLEKLEIHDSCVYHASHYRALQSLRDDDMLGLKDAVENARESIVQSLSNHILECTQTLYPILSQLQMLREIEEFAGTKPNNYDKLFDSWNNNDFVETHDFRYVEPILSQRLVMCQMRSFDDNSSLIGLELAHLKMAEVAETQEYLPIAHRVLGNLARRTDISEASLNQLTYQKAMLDWKENDHYMGRLVLRNLLMKSNLNQSLRAKALRVYGNWMAETTSEGFKEIVDRYQGSIEASTEVNDTKTLAGAQANLAEFADAQYRQIVEFTKTAQYDSLVECSKINNDGEKLRGGINSTTTEEERARHKYRRQVANDAAELEDIHSSQETYLLLAVRYYLTALTTDNDHDLLIYRVISLWLENTFNEGFNSTIEEITPKIGSHKFIVLLPQLATHLTNVSKRFAENIRTIVERCAIDHPHHSLPILLALRNTYKNQDYKISKQVSEMRLKIRLEPRLVAIEALFSKLEKSKCRTIIKESKQLYDALISLANYKIPKSSAKQFLNSQVIPKSHEIMKIRDFRFTTVPTMTINVVPSGNYENIVGIEKYEETFELWGRNNASKKIVCIDTTGKRRIQLLKSQSDVRLDAGLRQICTTINSMLRATRETERRKLRIRTYKIVPLSKYSGIIEWCQNSSPMSNILCDNEKILGLHAKYYPDDWTPSKCAMEFRKVQKLCFNVKLKTFLKCCENIRPAFHNYFMENYSSPEIWFEKRLAYVRSVATSSIIGYMFGLEDRTLNNILIDRKTGEVVHVDFGLNFDETRVTLRPETVPFRLTRDMESAMGICGVEGVMKICCEHTVTVLRERRKTLITMLRILVHDQMLEGTSLEDKDRPSSSGRCSRRSQGNRETDVPEPNEVAERALTIIEQKLEGMEDAVPSSICGQVERLIQEARDPANLCRMNDDWQPYL